MASPTHTSSVVFQLTEPGSWLENIAVRPDGTLLTTRLDKPELWLVDPATGQGSLLLTIPAAKSLTGIAEFEPDRYAIGAGEYNLASGPVPGSWGIWTVDLTGRTPAVSEVVRIPEVGLLNGLATWDARTVLLADSAVGTIWMVDVRTGRYEKALSDELMTPPAGSPFPLGVNGVKVQRQAGAQTYVWFTSTARMSFCRVPVEETACTATGPVEVVGQGFLQDDFCFDGEGAAYVVTNPTNTVVKVTGVGAEAVVVAGDSHSLELAGGTACAFGRTEADAKTLYVSTAGGLAMPVNGSETEPAKIAAIKLD